MRVQISIFFVILITLISAENVYKVRKLYRRSDTRRSAADDDLDMAAAELVFKEKHFLKSGGDQIEGPPRKLPFGTEHAASENTGAPSAEPTFAELQKTHLEDIEKEEGTLKSSMIGEGTEKLEENEGSLPSETPKAHGLEKNTFSGGVNDGSTSSVSSSGLLSWQQPLPSQGRLIAYDFHVNPEYPQFAPRARGLVGIPDGWNLDKQVDEEFRSGFRKVDFRRRIFLH
ncbi:hypothetical protein L5515_014096 [Caenorhabditis briggsae]|uniref:Uncharacterized protein n=1 Tax=Caenorhabditis briggsae TaxID=6238 RepID=A0AAE9EDD0_CAEBR|nr:hypothetical protein L5515_014096 [Caenorhabditis briggsae]